MKTRYKLIISVFLIALASAIAFYLYLPTNRVGITSELIMLGDLNNDNVWDVNDEKVLNSIIYNPLIVDREKLLKIDVNKNLQIDEEDLRILKHIYSISNPYIAEQKAKETGIQFPRPREFFKYLPKYEYIQRPLFILRHEIIKNSPLTFIEDLQLDPRNSPYKNQLSMEVYDEALRFTFAYNIRKDKLTTIERDYLLQKLHYCENLYQYNKYYELLLQLISLVEDAETLTTRSQSQFIKSILYFRDHLRDILTSNEYNEFQQGGISYLEIFKTIEKYLKSDLNISIDLNSLAPPRDLTDLKNYLDRAEWQAFKSKTKNDEFKKLVLFAQYDRRYLRSVSKTSSKFADIELQNHNLPMILLFREALRISNNKKSAIGLLDEAVRIPMGWVKSIPKNLLPSSLALDNFLLPGNKEDGSDKTRHWNVFGGIALYKSPKDSLLLSLRREIMDLRHNDYSPEAMQEFIRDTIANINGIYYVVSIDPNLISKIINQ